MSDNTNPIDVGIIYLPVINFAMQQNRVSVIRVLTIENKTEEVLTDIKINLTVEPQFAETTPHIIENIPPGNTVRVDGFKINLSTNFFISLTERMAGALMLEITSGEDILYKQSYQITILAFDQWAGNSVLPEMFSSFITPNHPSIVPIIKKASSILKQWTGNPSMDEYQSRNPDRVRKQMAALYNAIQQEGIVYSSVPASFEDYGQRVRLTDVVLSQKLGTCLDMALLYASCLEAVGIHPLIIFTQGHAFVGGWLVPETFPDSITDDVSFLTKRIADGINEITLVEATCMNLGNDADFDRAVNMANNQLQTGGFQQALDVKRSRFAGIRPLPQRVLNGEHWEIKEEPASVTDKVQPAPESVNPYDLTQISKDITITKQLMWERKLLDLSLRNNLLNIRITKNTLQLISADLDKFEDAMAEGDEFQIMPKPTDWDNPLYDYGLYHSIQSGDPVLELVKSEVSQKRLRSYLTENELNKALLHLYRSSRLSIEENGANTLYLALGLLKWYETPSSERPRYAPILLLPVEIIRKSAAKGYVIRSREEDSIMNITLLEMLRQNFGITITGLDPLPADESGIDVKLIYSIIRNSIKDQRKWDVEEQAILGIFSFNKFIMWNDIHNNVHKLVENKIVSSLINGKIEFDFEDNTANASVLERELPPTEIVLPISADSSQLEAVFEAVNDRTYILHGPPGTGKSQTITNIISNALYKGKRVLFVAEKMAALSVVQNRLAAIGLAPFCLELHSNKTKKSAILSQLKRTSEVVRLLPPEDFGQEAQRIHNLRCEMNKYVDALHKKCSFDISLYDAISRYLSIDCDIEFHFPRSLFEKLTKEHIQEWQDCIETLVSVGKACGHPHQHPLTGLQITHYSATGKEEISQCLKELIQLLAAIKSKLDQVTNLFGATNEGSYSKKQVDILSNIIRKILEIPELTPGVLNQHQLDEVLEQLHIVALHGKERDKKKEQLLLTNTSDILDINAKQLLSTWNECSNKWFIPKYFGQKNIRKQLTAYSLNSQLKNEQVKALLHNVIAYQNEKKYVEPYLDQLPLFFGKYGRRENEDWNTIEQIIDELAILDSLILNCTRNVAGAAKMKAALAQHLAEGIGYFKSIHSNTLTEFNDLLLTFNSVSQRLQSVCGMDISVVYGDSDRWIEILNGKLNTWVANIDELKDWYQWLLISEKLQKTQLGFVAEEYKNKNIPTGTLTDSFNKSFYRACIEYIVSAEPALELFKGEMFNDVISKYKELISNFQTLTRQELYAKLASNLPDFTREAAQNSEVGILQRNIKNNGRGMPIRRLFDQIPILLSRMCPCMLMSPISVAQYIDTDADKFDLVIFDEASQMPTYEAIGAISRGKNVIIVGDPKQMPPTSFFSVNTVDEDNIEMEDLESILDDCLALSMPSKHLLWHYRSKHESLIAFSNSEYYDNKLLTFPSPDNIESKVRFVPIQGCYDKGKTRQNKMEAQAVVDEIIRRLSDDDLRKRSIGVVTFSAVQQNLIEDLLSDLFTLRPDLETLSLECEEPLFIKNLENVQGDERDVILFSVGYGPDQEGKVSMNFGPLNRIGGERRLNVAVSRARYEMIIYSTLRADQIDLNRTSAVGVAGLKRFLEYAEKGGRLTTGQHTLATASVENDIAKKLRQEGYEVHTAIGCSGYKIDIGIVDKENPSNYILGILCDGENYRQTKTMRDREIVQTSVLKQLGWNIHRVWTMDWWENPGKVLVTIKRMIENPEQKSPQKPKPAVAVANNTQVHQSEALRNDNISEIIAPYIRTSLPLVEVSPEEFRSSGNYSIIKKQVKKVIETEAPISRSLVYRRILDAWGSLRSSPKMETLFKDLFSQLPYHTTTHEAVVFFWRDEEQAKTYTQCRPDSGRDISDFPPEEIANAIKYILENEISLPTKDLIRTTAHFLGFAKVGSNVDAAMYCGINEAIKRGYVKEEGGRVLVR
ncbi:DUF3320 domain-containing protein [Bacteroides sp. 519]|uniref:DUF3320 domain-containing protein n=1 Tax=Bacteroides sp. 519 TaxID=2302937 RepID=UPI0013D2A346|nr:DUF3320 domain-containing protein [Bacteroides sp. 519]NDV57427.1 DUF3320 domain-containing protein [Bacteroides sp. 519]